jgi:hypothetical protein
MNLSRAGINEKSERVPGWLEVITVASTHVGPSAFSSEGRIARVQRVNAAKVQTVGFDAIKERIVF